MNAISCVVFGLDCRFTMKISMETDSHSFWKNSSSLERELKLEKEQRQALQRELQCEKDTSSLLQAELQQVDGLKRVSGTVLGQRATSILGSSCRSICHTLATQSGGVGGCTLVPWLGGTDPHPPRLCSGGKGEADREPVNKPETHGECRKETEQEAVPSVAGRSGNRVSHPETRRTSQGPAGSGLIRHHRV